MSFNCRELLLAFARTARRVRHILTPGAVGGHRTGALQKARIAPYSSRRLKLIIVLWTVDHQDTTCIVLDVSSSRQLRRQREWQGLRASQCLRGDLPVEEGYQHETRKSAEMQPLITESYGFSNWH